MHIFAITGAVALASLNLFYLALSRGWFGPFERAGAGFCECFRPGLVKQPANTWSNLGFVAAGLAMAWSLSIGTFSRNRNALTQSSFNAIFFSSLVVLLGPGSMAMHASGAKFGGFLDVLSMYLVDGFLVAYSARRLFKLDNIFFALIFSVVLAACLVADRIPGKAFLNFGYGNVAFGSFIILTTIFEAFNIFARKMTHASAWAFGSFGAIVLAFFIWNMSLTGRPWCDHNSLIQGHAAWHLLDALSVYCLFRFYVSEDEAEAEAL